MTNYLSILKQNLRKTFIGGFNLDILNNQIELEVFRTEYLNAPQSIKTDLFELQLYKKFIIKNDFYLIYSLKDNRTENVL